jgi:hypothetical protein
MKVEVVRSVVTLKKCIKKGRRRNVSHVQKAWLVGHALAGEQVDDPRHDPMPRLIGLIPELPGLVCLMRARNSSVAPHSARSSQQPAASRRSDEAQWAKRVPSNQKSSAASR